MTAASRGETLSDKMLDWKKSHSRMIVMQGNERYWFFAFKQLDELQKQFIKDLKEEIVNLEDTDNWDIIILPLIDKLAGDKLTSLEENGK